MPRLSQFVWGALLRGAVCLSLICLMASWHLRRFSEAVDGFITIPQEGFFGVGLAAAGCAAMLLWFRPRAGYGPPVPAAKKMACGGTMTPASFKGGSGYGACSARCVHSRADFEARR